MSSTRPCNSKSVVTSLIGGVLLPLLLCSCATVRTQQNFSEELALSPGPGELIEGVPGLTADRANGGIAAMSSLFAFWKTPVLPRESENRLAAGTSSLLIPPEEVMTDLADRRMLWTYAFYATIEEVEARLEAGIPLLVMVQDRGDDSSTRRYMLVVGYIQSAQKVLVHEGSSRPVVYDYGAFKRIWRPVRNWTLVVCPPDRITWPLNERERVARARFYERTGQWTSALVDLDRLQAAQPGNINIMLAKARVFQRAGNPTEAERQYRLALELDPLNARAANNLAYQMMNSGGDLAEAERWSRRALTIEPSNPSYLDTRGAILLLRHRPAEAAAVLERALHRADNLPPASRREIQTRLIQAFVESNQTHLARQIVDDIRRQDPRYVPPAQWRDVLK